MMVVSDEQGDGRVTWPAVAEAKARQLHGATRPSVPDLLAQLEDSLAKAKTARLQRDRLRHARDEPVDARCPECRVDPCLLRHRRGGRSAVKWMVHNVIAHPLLILCPPLGRWLHDLTAPE